MKAIILAAGQGTRLRPVTLTMPKPLVPVANKSLIAYAIDMLKGADLKDIGIVVHTMDSPIVSHLGDGAKMGVHLEYIVQEQQKGLAHAVSLCKDFVGNEPFALFLGDNIFQDKMESLLRSFPKSSFDAAIALNEVSDPSRFGIAVLEGGRIKEVIEKPPVPPSNLAIAGVYMFRSSIFDAISKIKPSKRNELEITDAIQQLITDGNKVQPYILDGWWIDAGKPDAIIQANQLVMGDMPYTPAPEDPKKVIGKSQVSNRVIYTALGDNVTIENSEIEASIVMRDCIIRNISGRIDSSLLADYAQVTAGGNVPAAHRFILAENSYVQM
jgi:glucose-1-phosphate thymidylyltransferase